MTELGDQLGTEGEEEVNLISASGNRVISSSRNGENKSMVRVDMESLLLGVCFVKGMWIFKTIESFMSTLIKINKVQRLWRQGSYTYLPYSDWHKIPLQNHMWRLPQPYTDRTSARASAQQLFIQSQTNVTLVFDHFIQRLFFQSIWGNPSYFSFENLPWPQHL